MEKQCTKCLATKPLGQFYKDKRSKDGHTSRCRDCVLDYQRSPKGREVNKRAVKRYSKTDKGKARRKAYQETEAGRLAHKKAVRKYDRSPHGKAKAEDYRKSPRGKAARRRYRESEKGRQAAARATKKYREKWPEKHAAWVKVQKAIRRGQIKPPEKCPICGNTEHIAAHHGDYSKPLEIDWMCAQCHVKKHNKIK